MYKKYLLIYKIQIIFCYLKLLKINKKISYKKNSFFFNNLLILKHNIINENFLKFFLNKFKILKKLFIDFSIDHLTLKLFLKKELNKINILLIFIRKNLINLSFKWKNDAIIFSKENMELTTLGNIFLYWNELIKFNHEFLFFCKKKINYLNINYNFIIKYKILNLNLLKKMLGFNKIYENIFLNNTNNYYLEIINFSLFIILNLLKIFNMLCFWENEKIFFNKNIKNLLLTIKIFSNKIIGIYINYIFNITQNIKNTNDTNNIIEIIFIIKNILNYFRILLFCIKINKKNMYFLSLKNNSYLEFLKMYLKKKKINFVKIEKIIYKCKKYCFLKKKIFYNIKFKDLKKICYFIDKNIYLFISINNILFKKSKFTNFINFKILQKSKYNLNKLILSQKL